MTENEHAINQVYVIANALQCDTVGREPRLNVIRTDNPQDVLATLRTVAGAADIPVYNTKDIENEAMTAPSHVVARIGAIDGRDAKAIVEALKKKERGVHLFLLIPETGHLESLDSLGEVIVAAGLYDGDALDPEFLPRWAVASSRAV